jgi:hypothetical protein
MTDEQWEDREREYHGAIWKLLNEIWDLQNEIRKLKGGETEDEKRNRILYFDRFWNGTFSDKHHAECKE